MIRQQDLLRAVPGCHPGESSGKIESLQIWVLRKLAGLQELSEVQQDMLRRQHHEIVILELAPECSGCLKVWKANTA